MHYIHYMYHISKPALVGNNNNIKIMISRCCRFINPRVVYVERVIVMEEEKEEEAE